MFGQSNQAMEAISGVFRRIAHAYFSWHSLTVFLLSVGIALLLGRLVAAVLRRTVAMIGARADKTENLQTVNRLRRYETIIVLSIAVLRTVLLAFALYFWWTYVHPGGSQPSAVIGASAVVLIVLGNTLAPALRDITSGGLMMAEQWYGVGDHIRIEPFADMQGVVERITLRSTRIRGLNGEVMWVNNQNIAGVRIAPKGIRTLAIELFVRDLKHAERLIQKANQRLPRGPLLVVRPLAVMTTNEVGSGLWHLTAVAETAPGREWLLERYAIDVLKEIDGAAKQSVLATEPVARYADSEAERRFARTIHNAGKRPAPSKPKRTRAR